jgi:hypothetical protein
MSQTEQIQLIQEINEWLDIINDHTIYSLIFDDTMESYT